MYHGVFTTALENLGAGQTIWLDELLNLPDLPQTSRATKKKHLRTLVEAQPQLLEKIKGLYPSADTVINLVQLQHNAQVVEANLDLSNQRAAAIIRRLGRPVFDRFVSENLAEHIDGQNISLTRTQLMDFLLEDFTEFMKGAGNGLVSIAGTLNERLLIRALENGDLVKERHFTKTGTNGQADLIIHSNARNHPNLGVEIKSYHARERLLRGLQDITGSKIGVGFFKDHREFNVERTITLIQTQAAAIYMPRSTLELIDPEARIRTVNVVGAVGSKFYRPIEQFVTDMTYFYNHGSLPAYLP